MLKAYPLDKAYCSVLKRAIQTLEIVLEETGRKGIPVVYDQALNERHYGELQGLDKAEMARRFGERQVNLWRRSYEVAPPGGESLRDTARRTLPFFKKKILEDVAVGKNVLVSAHGNSLRSIVMDLDGLSAEEVVALNIPTGVPLLYEFSPDLKILSKKNLSRQATS